MSQLLSEVLLLLQSAKTSNHYARAKQLASGLSMTEQHIAIDNFIPCQRRLEAMGVL